MGFYDYRCMATGVSLKGAKTALVLLIWADTGDHPIALAVTGQYNRLGSIDAIEEDDNTRLIFDYFLARLRGGELVVDEAELGGGQIKDLERLLELVERCVTMDDDTVVLDGRRVLFALVSRVVWDAIARQARSSRESSTALFQRLFGGVAVAQDIYKGSLTKVSRHLRELAAVQDFLVERGIAWRPPDDPEQHYAEEMAEYLRAAREQFRDCPAVLEGLDAYKEEAGDLLEEE
jgi:hypothetical protein